MLSNQRKQYILDQLKIDGQVVAKALAKRFAVSEDTIRRDLRELAREGLLHRVHGGALPSSPAVTDFSGRKAIEVEGKKAIATKAAALVEDGHVVILDGGTTSVEMAKRLDRNIHATVVTHSPSIAVELIDHPYIEVILIGGKLFKHSMVTVGTAALEALESINADIFFMGVTGIRPDTGFSTGDYEEAHMKKALSNHAAETIVLASADKLNAASRYQIGELSLASTLVIEKNAHIDNELSHALTISGIEIIWA